MLPGGAETLLANSLAPGGLQDYFDNTLIYFNGDSHILKQLDKNVKVICLNYNGVLGLPQVLYRINKIIRQNRIDVIHTHLVPTSFFTYLAKPSIVPQVHTIHTTYSMDTENSPKLLFLEKHLYLKRKNVNIILLSNYIKTDFLNTISFRGNSFVLNNFVADRFFENVALKKEQSMGELKMVAVGRLSKVKNFKYLLDVFDYLKEMPISLDIYGGGENIEYEQLILAKKIKVRMMGLCTNVAEVLPKYDVFIMPSKFEGFPLSVFEAMASGLILLLSNIAPLKNMAKDNALYFELTDAKSVAETIKKIFNNQFNIQEMREMGIEYANENGRREKYINGLVKIYAEIRTQRLNKK
jgi:glycosyltransferase involved in cell wall biosynthesis